MSHHFRNDIVIWHLLVRRILVFKEALQQNSFRIRGSPHAFFGAHLIHAGADKLNSFVNQDWRRRSDKEPTLTSPIILSESQIWRHRWLGIRQIKSHKAEGAALR